MRKEKLSKKVVTGILATALCATAFTGCGKKAADGMTVLEEKVPQQADSGIYKQANLEGITKEGEYLEFFDYESGRVIAVAHGQDGKRRCVSFKSDGSDIKSFDIAGDGNSMSALFTADKDGNLYMQYQEFSEEKGGAEDEEGVAHAGENDGSPEANGDGENDDASVGDSVPATEEGAEDISYKVSKAFLVKFDTTGKEVLNKDIIDAFSGEETFSVNGLVWTQKNGLLFNTTKGIMKFDENSGLSTVMERGDFGDSYEGYCTLFKGADDQLFASIYRVEGEGYMCYKVDLDNKKLSDPLGVFNDNYYDFFSGEGYDFYAADTEALYGYDSKAGKAVKVVDFPESGMSPDVAGIVLNHAVIVSDKEIIADMPGGSEFTANICKLTKS